MVMPSFVQPRSRSRYSPLSPSGLPVKQRLPRVAWVYIVGFDCRLPNALLAETWPAAVPCFMMLLSRNKGQTRISERLSPAAIRPAAVLTPPCHAICPMELTHPLCPLLPRCCPAAAPSRHTALHLPAQHRPTRRHLTASAGTPRDWLPDSDPAALPNLARTLSPAPPAPVASSANALVPSCHRRRRRYAALRLRG